MEMDAEFWVIIALVIFVAVVLYLRVPKLVAKVLDARIEKIKADIDEAAKLRAEAKALLDSYANKRSEAEAEAAGIVTAAREEADRLAKDAASALEALIVRRTKGVEEKIAQAEQQAVAEVRGRSADVAIEAARVLLNQQMQQRGDALVTQSIKDVAAKLN